MKKKFDSSLMFLVLGLALALLTGVFVLKGQEYYNQLVPVIYSGVSDIPAYTTIKESDIVEIKVPKVVLQQNNIFVKKEEVIGKVAKTLITSNSPVFKNQIINIKNGNNNLLAANLTQIGDPELLAFTIPTNQIAAVGGKILPSDKVHIIANMEINSGQSKKRVSKIVVPYARVVDVIGRVPDIKGLTFALTPQQVLDLGYIMKTGSISFALLPYNYNKDHGEAVTSEESIEERYFSSRGE